MELARGVAGLVRLASLTGLRTQFDFDAPGLDQREQLVRLQHAAEQAIQQCGDDAAAEELAFALADCRMLLAMESLEGEAAVEKRVPQRLLRIRRVVTHYEGRLARWNRRYWWAACAAGLIVMVGCYMRYICSL